ncbi:RNA polymerase sigma factor [Effusibacillus consociatus]|uniref:RNA polymerase sigma factor n=1 Tax=Effusibacillus consociatus TaxID=1117041 RepID=A0ABV9Q4V6_9BACL
MFSGGKKRGWGFARKKEEMGNAKETPQDPSELFTSLYDQYFDKVNRYLRYRIGNLWDADDVTAVVFTKAYEACKRDGISEHFGPWIFRVAQNAYVDYLRKRGRSLTVDQELHAEISDDSWQTEEEVMIQENTRTLHEMLAQLPDEYRDVVSLKYIAELKISEIADVLDKTEGAVKTLLYRAIRKLRGIYEEAERRERDE